MFGSSVLTDAPVTWRNVSARVCACADPAASERARKATTESRRFDPVTLIDRIPIFQVIFGGVTTRIKQGICQKTCPATLVRACLHPDFGRHHSSLLACGSRSPFDDR